MLAKPNMLTEALSYAKRGWPVFPCDPDTDPDRAKRPLIAGADLDAAGQKIPKTGGLYRATTDEQQIREWWGKWPAALIGVPTGAKIGLWVLDYDPDGETVEDIERRVIEAIEEPLPVGPRSKTQSGGAHIWLKLPAGELPKNSAKRLKNVDWRGEGGYVIVPPSRMADGNAYEWTVSPDLISFPDPPPLLLDLVFRRGKFAPPKREVAARDPNYKPPEGKVRRYCEVALSKATGRIRVLAEGQRNVEINNESLAIGHLVGAGGLGKQEAYDAIHDAALALGIPESDRVFGTTGTIWRALSDGEREPADLSHVGRREVTRAVAEAFGPQDGDIPGQTYDEETGEVIADADEERAALTPADFMPENGPTVEGMPEGDEPDYGEVDGQPFRCLGYNRGVYFYFSTSTQQIAALKAPEHTPLNLMRLADLNYWTRLVDAKKKISGEQWQQIAGSLMEACHSRGIFVEKYVRGRGAWFDGKTVIVHTGDSARIGGETAPLSDIPGRYIYEKSEPWAFEFGSPATSKEAHKLAEVCARLTWQDPISGALFCGWNIIAPVCGALRWRPHIWVTGPSQAGKTTAIDEIVMRVTGPAGEHFQGNTTEAGIRQIMGFDARPIILDEAETEDNAAVQRMQAILALARIASSGGTVAKGSQSGRAMSFVVRSCFCFSSINTALRHHADESRVTKLVLSKNTAPDALEHYRNLVRDISAWFTPEYAGAMFSRTVRYLPELLDNIETFKVAAALAFRNRRAADQIGPMLAGYYLCHKTGRISLAEAEKFIGEHDWTEHAALESAADELRLFAYLMSRRIRVNIGHGGGQEMSVGQAIEGTRIPDETSRFYIDALGPRGIKVTYDKIVISNTADGIREFLKDQPWVNDWRRPLSMIAGAEKLEPTYFAAGLTSRAVALPYELLDGGGL